MAYSPPPTRFVDVPTALTSYGSVVSVTGVVVDVFRGVWKSQGSSSCITFTIKDADLNNGHTWDGLKIKYFKDDESKLPPVQHGDVILLRNIYVKRLQGKPVAVAAQNKNIPWAIFRHDLDPTSTTAPICGPDHFELSSLETRRSKALLELIAGTKKFRDESAMTIAPSASFTAHTPESGSGSRTSKKKFSLIRDARENTYVDLVCEVVKVDLFDSTKAQLYVTDYTANRKLYDRTPDDDDVGFGGDRFNYQRKKTWPGPVGQRSLPVLLWEPHASYARDLKESDFVRLSNVHMKLDRLHQQHLEAVVHTSRNNPYEVLIDLVDAGDDEQAGELLRRKEEYWKQNPRKRQPDDEEQQAPKSKKAKNKQRKQEQKKREEGQKPLVIKKTQPANKHVVAGNPSIDCLTIEDIMNNNSHNNESPDKIEYRLPFQNLCYRSTVRVVDFFPPNLEDFAVPESDECLTSGNKDNVVRWEWRFCLLIESASPPPAGQPKEQMKLYVAGPEAVYLLRLDASE
ncbi:hypothetical protein FE257_001641 [Aspergillus nanangensis]|uniref:Protection of telomeres protein 1 n=1 Tax=Aspergillus nanangensis TaxID=2582783 RepID=A0AAD4CVL1_ASPNN|nr:hypothetical protein FE257_001641 [Aspergillus nanangensis]